MFYNKQHSQQMLRFSPFFRFPTSARIYIAFMFYLTINQMEYSLEAHIIAQTFHTFYVSTQFGTMHDLTSDTT